MQRLWDWFDERLHLAPLWEVLQENLRKPSPRHVNWLFTMGSALLLLLGVQLLHTLLLCLNGLNLVLVLLIGFLLPQIFPRICVH